MLFILYILLFGNFMVNATVRDIENKNGPDELALKSVLLSNQLVRREFSYKENGRTYANVIDLRAESGPLLSKYLDSFGLSYISASYLGNTVSAGSERIGSDLFCRSRFVLDDRKKVVPFELCIQ
jgi:hypothetical protein